MFLIIYTFFQKCNSLFRPFLQDFRKKPRIDITLKQNTPQKQDQCKEVAHAEAKNIPFSACRRQGDSSLPSGCTQQPSEITRQGRGKSVEKEPEKRIKDLPFRSADRQPRERRHTENHMPKRQQWQNTHRLPSIQREVPQMPVLTVPLEDRKSRPLRKFFFQKRLRLKEADAISLLHSVWDAVSSSSTPRVIPAANQRAKKRIYAFSSRSLICFLRLLIFCLTVNVFTVHRQYT